ncbi:hypothetical protein DESUT3_35400 [Desulfuromonas versatilis]|uniref:VOC domain-containing protein n=1 Tax=Desulfuromonas versatilis TaxID=2802975 RepID=A0ABN6E286_9BACT|nr:hypothetical protein [Desulfuromonas versatilis]BCR06471.1 hypothetical protein DESUT3_35400 [Desulfuromonas versatilis]
MKPRFGAGRNIALKIPSHQFAATLAFYRDILGLVQIEQEQPLVVFDYAGMRLWLDEVPQLSQAELWLEVTTDDTAAAAKYLEEQGVARCDGVEALPKGFDGFWICSPAGIVHLVCRDQAPGQDPAGG